MPDLRLSWGDYPGGYATEVTGSETIDTGGVAVTVDYTNIAASATAFALNLETYDDPGDDLPPSSQLKLISDGGAAGDTSSTTLSFESTDALFGDAVTDLSFRIDDIDAGPLADIDGTAGNDHEDVVNVRAFDLQGNEIPVSITAGAGITTVGQTLDGDTQGEPTDAANSALFEIAGPVGSVIIEYANTGVGEQEVLVSDLLFTTTDPVVNEDPTANPDFASTPADTLLEDIDVLGNDSDPDGDPLTVSAASAPNGTVTINADGTLDYDPTPGFTGDDTISYTISDGLGGTDTSTVTVTVTAADNDLPIAVDDTATAISEVLLEDIDVLGNDSDPDGDPLTVTTATAANGAVTINADGTLNYLSDTDFLGQDTITYTIDDGISGTDTAQVIVSVGSPDNEAPTALPDQAETDADVAVTIFPLGNDTDPNGDLLTITSATAPNGSVVISADGTNVTYTPDPGFDDAVDTISYTISDGFGGTDSSTIQVLVGDLPLDGIVEGTAGDDLIIGDDPATVGVDEAYTGDPEGDEIDNSDAILPEAGANDDVVEAGAGDDTVVSDLGDDFVTAGEGDDVVSTGEGDDTVVGDEGDDIIDTGDGDDSVFSGDDNDTVTTGDGEDTVLAGLGDDVIDTSGSVPAIDSISFPSVPTDSDTEDDRDFVDGDEGDDLITTGDDADTVIGGEGNDTIFSGIDDDSVVGDGGDDLIIDSQGSDFVDGGDGDDTITVGVDTFSDYIGDDPNLPFVDSGTLFDTDPNVDDGRDTVLGGDGNDVISTGDDADSIDGGADDDTINAGIDDDTVLGGTGDDSILGGHGSDDISGDDGNDFIDAGHTGTPGYIGDVEDAAELPGLELNDRDTVDGGDGDDTILGGDDDDSLLGGSGDDSIDGGIDEDTILGGVGDDTLIGGAGADSISGGDDEDSIIGATAGDVVDGGAGGVDFDVLDLTGAGEAANVGGRVAIEYTSADLEDGIVRFLDAAGVETGTATFTDIENVIPCFTPGTMIATPQGERAVEELKVGDRVITRDNGIQEICWTGAKDLTGDQLAANEHLQPILIQAGALGDNLPEQDILVSPQHRMLLTTDKAAMYFEEREVLVAAKHLTMLDGVDRVESSGTTYIHIMFQQHEVVLSNGTWSESFQPGDYALDGIGKEQRDEILELFPELATTNNAEVYQAARRTLKKYEAALLLGE